GSARSTARRSSRRSPVTPRLRSPFGAADRAARWRYGEAVNADPAAQRRLLDLQAVDTTLAQLAHRRRSLPELAEIARHDGRLAALSGNLVRLETEVGDLAREERRLENDVEQVRQRAAPDTEGPNAGRVGSPKELESLQHEVGSLARRQSDLEDQILELMERREEVQGRLDRMRAEVESVAAGRDAAAATRDKVWAEIDG